MNLFKTDDVKTAVGLFDLHIPYNDKRAKKLVVNKVMVDLHKRTGIDEIILGGDIGDFFAVSSHAKDPSLPKMLKQEIEAVNDFLDELDDLFPRVKKVYVEGNHETRLIRFIRDRAPELYGLVDAPSLFKLDKRKDYSWVPFGPYQKYNVLGSHLIVRHAPIGGGDYVAAASVKKAGSSVMFGDRHRIQEHQIVTLDDANHRGIAVGWLGDKTHPAFQYVANHAEWAQGFSVTRVLPNRIWFNQNVQIIDYMCMVDGKIYVG